MGEQRMGEVRRIGPENEPGQNNVIVTLAEAQGAVMTGRVNADQALVLLLERGTDEEPEFTLRFFNAGLKMSECLVLCEVAKTRFLGEMKYLVTPEDPDHG